MIRTDAYYNKLKLLTACRDVIAEQRTTAVTVKEIISQAGLSSTTFFRHFDSKDSVIDEVSVSRWSLLELYARRPECNLEEGHASLVQVVSILELFTRMINSDDHFINATGLRIGHSPAAIRPIRTTFEPNFATLWVDAQRREQLRTSAHPRDAMDMAASIRNQKRRIPMLTTLVSGISTNAVDAEALISELFLGANEHPNRQLPMRYVCA